VEKTLTDFFGLPTDIFFVRSAGGPNGIGGYGYSIPLTPRYIVAALVFHDSLDGTQQNRMIEIICGIHRE
jgi:hypothetical protein